SYFVGSIPTSYLVGRWARGIDLREHGSRNLGATNVYRTLGWKFAIPVGLVDVAKGAVPVLLFGPRAPGVPYFPIWCGIAAVLGHVFSVFVRFKGGKGVATAAGMVIALAPLAFPVVLVIWGLVVWGTGYVSLGSITAALVFPFADWWLHPARRGPVTLLIDLALAGFIIWKHRANIQRLLAGTENRFGRRGAKPPASAA
ncbi:MAG TPA: glycerol-3-phosphate 1-O-acyltransferase PlsY, partial [Gemmatimonadales bacterium]|nr:glycerol-3-phosphate 1-O-acyltransferase PlsY [Gemmatimonadales bacterium]